MAASTRYKHGGAQPTIATAPTRKSEAQKRRDRWANEVAVQANAFEGFPEDNKRKTRSSKPVPFTPGVMDDASIVLNQLVGGDPTLQAFIKLLSAKRT